MYGFLWVLVATFKLSLVVVNRLLVAVDSLVVEHSLYMYSCQWLWLMASGVHRL